MQEKAKQEHARIIKTFSKVAWGDEKIVLLDRQIHCGAIRPRESLTIRKVAIKDKEVLELFEDESPLERIGQILSTEAGYRFLTALINLRIDTTPVTQEERDLAERDGTPVRLTDPITLDDLLDAVDGLETGLDLLTSLLSSKTLDELRAEHQELQAEYDPEESDEEDEELGFAGEPPKSLPLEGTSEE